MNITHEQLKQIIKEELEVILTDEEAAEFFGDDIKQYLQEINQVDQGLEKKVAAAEKASPLIAVKRAIDKKTSGKDKTLAVIQVIKSLLGDDPESMDLLVRNISVFKKGLQQEPDQEQPEQ